MPYNANRKIRGNDFMKCPVSQANSMKNQCSGICCVCIKKSVKEDISPICLSFFRNGESWLLTKMRLRKKPEKDSVVAANRRLVCPLQTINRGMCPCTKDCPFIESALCCLCIERYVQKGSLPKCFRVGLKHRDKVEE